MEDLGHDLTKLILDRAAHIGVTAGSENAAVRWIIRAGLDRAQEELGAGDR